MRTGQIQGSMRTGQAARQPLQHVNNSTVPFHDLEEKIEYLIENQYYEPELFDRHNFQFIKNLFKRAYAVKFRPSTFLGAFVLHLLRAKTFDGQRYLGVSKTASHGSHCCWQKVTRSSAEDIVDGAPPPAVSSRQPRPSQRR